MNFISQIYLTAMGERIQIGRRTGDSVLIAADIHVEPFVGSYIKV